MRAHFFSLTGQIGRAVDEGNKLAEKYKADATSNEEARGKAIDVRYNMALIYQRKDRFQEAADAFKDLIAIATRPRTPVVVLNNYAYLLADNLGKPGEAIELAEDAANMTNHADPNVLDTLGWCYLKSAQTLGGTEARERAQKGVDFLEEAQQTVAKGQREELPIIHYHLACGYQQLRNLDEARKSVERAIKLCKKDAKEDEPIRIKAEALAKSLNETPGG